MSSSGALEQNLDVLVYRVNTCQVVLLLHTSLHSVLVDVSKPH